MENEILFLSGILHERIWGSNYFKDTLSLTKSNNRFGEYWTLSAHPDGESIVTNGEYKGLSLKQVFHQNPSLFGYLSSDFPVIIKLIATSDNLSIQVHPGDEYAEKVEKQKGKTEGWLILAAEENSQIVLGHNAKNKDEFISLFNNKKYSELFNYIKVKRGMFIPVEAGIVHAIGKGIVLLEVQQSSNVTYRLYDYDRLDFNNKPRALHLEKALDVISFEKQEVNNHNFFDDEGNYLNLWSNNYFNIVLYKIHSTIEFKPEHNKFYLGTIIEGLIEVNEKEVKVGESFVVTSKAKKVTFKGFGKFVITSLR